MLTEIRGGGEFEPPNPPLGTPVPVVTIQAETLKFSAMKLVISPTQCVA
jgi:hypothetical protein